MVGTDENRVNSFEPTCRDHDLLTKCQVTDLGDTVDYVSTATYAPAQTAYLWSFLIRSV